MKKIKLGEKVKDKFTGLTVMPTHLSVWDAENKVRNVLVQPEGLDPKTGLPVTAYWTTEERLGVEIEATLPFHLIGSPAEDLASGYKGTISSLSLHINGCLHIAIQAKGTQEDGDKIPELDIDIRRVKGPKVAAFTKGELEKSIKENPSPILYQKYAPALSRPLPKICPQLVK